jgi:hypothetical protein
MNNNFRVHQVAYKNDEELKRVGEEAVVAYFDIHQKGLRKAMKMYGMQALRCVS